MQEANFVFPRGHMQHYRVRTTFLKYRYALFIVVWIMSVAHAAIYQQLDSQGIMHFSDKPSAGATVVNLPTVNTVISSQSKTAIKSTTPTHSSYQTLRIIQPADQQTFQNQLSISVAIQLQPQLQPQDSLQVWLDGKLMQQTTEMQFTLTALERGSHQLQIKIVGADGQQQLASAPVTFYVHQARVEK